MSTESAMAFAERLKTDQAFATKLADAPSREERRALVKAEGFDLSDDDFGAVRQALGIEELSDEDLERVAGGSNTTTVTAVVTDTVVIATIIAAITSYGR